MRLSRRPSLSLLLYSSSSLLYETRWFGKKILYSYKHTHTHVYHCIYLSSLSVHAHSLVPQHFVVSREQRRAGSGLGMRLHAHTDLGVNMEERPQGLGLGLGLESFFHIDPTQAHMHSRITVILTWSGVEIIIQTAWQAYYTESQTLSWLSIYYPIVDINWIWSKQLPGGLIKRAMNNVFAHTPAIPSSLVYVLGRGGFWPS